MKRTLALLTLAALAAMPLAAADLNAEVKAAAKKLSESANYSWTSKSDSTRPPGQGTQGGQGGQGGQAGQGRGGAGRFGGGFGGGGMPDGRIDKDGLAVLTYRFGENATEVIVKNGKVAIKSGDEWKTAEELADAGDGDGQRRGPGRFLARGAQSFKAPAVTAQDLAGKVTGVKKDGDAYVGDLTAEAIKEMYTFRGRRPGGNNEDAPPPPDTSGLKGTVKFSVKDGVLTQYEQHIQGKMKGREDREIEINRTTTVLIKDIGTTKMDVPPEAKKKLAAN